MGVGNSAGVLIETSTFPPATDAIVRDTVFGDGNGSSSQNGCIEATLRSLLLDGDFIECSNDGVIVFSAIASSMDVTIQNSYFTKSSTAVDLEGVDGGVVNNTFQSNGTAVSASGSPTIVYENNLFVGNGVALDLGTAPTSIGHNGFWQNTTKFAGLALAGTGDVNADPLLDSQVPPGLGAGSPCVGAADPTEAPPTDYYGRARGSAPDIGAVQRL